MQQAGREQNLAGQGQEAKGQLSDLGQGITDRVSGAVGGAGAALTGNRDAQAKFADQHDEGKTRQRELSSISTSKLARRSRWSIRSPSVLRDNQKHSGGRSAKARIIERVRIEALIPHS